MQLFGSHMSVDVCNVVQTIADQLVGLEGASWSLDSDLQQVTLRFVKDFHASDTMDHECDIFTSEVKGDITHKVSPNLMLILSTYRVVLQPSYLQKVFSFIIFIKER